MRVVAVVLAVASLAGCATQVLEPQPVTVSGDPDGTIPTNMYLKTDVQKGGGDFTIVAFDRKDWYVAGLEKELFRTDWLVVAGTQELDREVLVEDVAAPSDLAARFRYDDMAASKEQRARMDREWDDRLAALAREKVDPVLPGIP